MIRNKYGYQMHRTYAYYSSKSIGIVVLLINAVMCSLYIDYSSSAIVDKYAVWQACLPRSICQQCKLYVYQGMWWHC